MPACVGYATIYAMTRALLFALAAAAIFSLFFVPTFVVVSRGLLREAAMPASLDQLEAPPLAAPVVVAPPPTLSTTASSTVLAGAGANNTLVIGGKKFVTEIADTDATRQLGLSNRPSLPATSAMLFVFPAPSNWGFWMKDTLIPLDMFWLDGSGRVVYLQQNVATSTYPAIFAPPASSPALYVIEANAGTAAKVGVTVGSVIGLPSAILAPGITH